jgi:fimbrial chaperone protein
VLVTAAVAPASASGLRVEPVLLDMNAPQAAGILTLRNNKDAGVSVQTRVFRWTQENGTEHLEPATGVAASPPIVTLLPGGEYTVRVVRTSKTPVSREEAYRVWVDELPASGQSSQSGVTILLRQSIPIFFRARQVTPPQVSWSYRFDGGQFLVTARNTGDERLRIASMRLSDNAGRTAGFGNGLVGYVLGQSSMTFTVPNPPRGFGASGTISVAAESNVGAVHATASLQTGP